MKNDCVVIILYRQKIKQHFIFTVKKGSAQIFLKTMKINKGLVMQIILFG